MTHNPPAFPRTGEGMGSPHYDEPGMTLRDWFAGQTLVAVGLWCPNRQDGYRYPVAEREQRRAEWCYRQADAMLAARAKETSRG